MPNTVALQYTCTMALLWPKRWHYFQIFATVVTGLAIDPIFRSSTGTHSTAKSNMSTKDASADAPLVVFLHGRLEADPHEDLDMNIPEPENLYREFCIDTLEMAPEGSTIFLPAYHRHYKDWKREPRYLGLGPVSTKVAEAIRHHIVGNPNERAPRLPRRVILMSFSMGAAILLKLLKSDPFLSSSDYVKVERLILIEPVWRCWLPFTVSEASSASRLSKDAAAIVSDIPALAIVGTNDDEVQYDSGGSGTKAVARSLRPMLGNVTLAKIEGGNHFGGICSGVDTIAVKGVPVDKSLSTLRKEIVSEIAVFCGWER